MKLNADIWTFYEAIRNDLPCFLRHFLIILSQDKASMAMG